VRISSPGKIRTGYVASPARMISTRRMTRMRLAEKFALRYGVASVQTQSKVLVVEDHPQVGPMTVRLLESAGYEVVLAADGDAAVAAARGQRFDLVISDVVLPDSRDGVEVVEALRKIQPDLKALFMSGYGAPRYGRTSNDPILSKPFKASDLITRVERLMV
jgi:CheY-like chemotaxis protein